MDRRPGDIIDDRFELTALVGTGGMGAVFRAVDRTTGHTVAVKMLEPTETQRFGREVAALESLDDPAIVRYVAHGVDAGSPYLAMEWVAGEDLETRLQRGPLTASETAVLGRRIASALAAAHARGIVHRDIKPANVLLPHGQLDGCKLVDFGIARVVSHRTVTVAGEIIGTPGFMAPEQARGARSSTAGDVFSLGCVLYECLTGRPAFPGETLIATLTKVLFEQVEPPDIDTPIADAIMRMLCKEPHERPADGAAAFALLSATAITERPRVPAFGKGELRFVAVIVTDAAAVETAGTLAQSMSASFQAIRVERLVGGGRVAVVVSETVATDLARRAVRTALTLAQQGAVVVATGRALASTRVPVGDVIDRAARLLEEEKARGGSGVRVDDTTASLVGGRFELVLREGSLYATREHAREPVRTLLGKTPPCVGRERELALLGDLFRECIGEPTATAVTITGPAGGGKSRLLAEWLSTMQGTETWVARGDPMSAGSAFALVGQLLRGTAGIAFGEPEDQARAKMLARASRNPEAQRVAAFLGEMAGVRFPADERSLLFHAREDGQRMGDQMLSAWLDFVEGELAAQPLVIVLEDLHWGDQATVRLCDAALRVCSERPLMIVAVARPELDEVFPKLFTERHPHAMALAPLGKRVCEQFVRSMLDGADAAQIVEHAHGNPLVLEELVRARVEGRGGEMPESVIAIVQSRLGLLSDAARRMLRAASVFGGTFWESAVRVLVPDAAELIDPLIERDIVMRRAQSRFEGERELAFRHVLVRDAAYLMLVDEDRAFAHRMAGEWLEQKGERDAAAVAGHFHAAGDVERALGWYKRAAEQAYEGASLDQAVNLAERAISCGATAIARGELRLLQARAHFWHANRAEQVAAARAATDDLTPPAIFDALGVVCAGCLRLKDAKGALDAARRLADRADISATCGANAAWMSSVLRYTGNPVESDRMLDIAENVALHTSDSTLDARLHSARGVKAKFTGDLGAALDEVQQVCAAWKQLGDAKELTIASLNVGDALLNVGRYAEARTTFERVLSDAERIGLRNMASMSRLNLAEVLFHIGAMSEARALALAAAREFDTFGDQYFARIAHAIIARTHFAEGDLARAEAIVRELGQEKDTASVEGAMVLAEVALKRGNATEALEALAPTLDALNHGRLEEGSARARCLQAVALARAGHVDAARRVLADAKAHILEQASKIQDESLRQSFVNKTDHARALTLEL